MLIYLISLAVVSWSIFLLLRLITNISDAYMFRNGTTWLVYLSGLVGVPIHEIGHAVAAKIFSHKINDIQLFCPKDNGQLGVVKHSYNSNSFYQRMGCFFIGLAPLASGLFACQLITDLMWGDFNLISNTDEATYRIVELGLFAATQWFFMMSFEYHVNLLIGDHVRYLSWAFMITSVIKHTLPSRPDIKGSKTGVLPLGVVLVCLYAVIPDELFGFIESVLLFTLSLQVVFVAYVIFMQVIFLLFTYFFNYKRGTL